MTVLEQYAFVYKYYMDTDTINEEQKLILENFMGWVENEYL